VRRIEDNSMSTTLAGVMRLIGAGAVIVAALTVRAHACSTPVTNLAIGVIDGWQQHDLPPIPRNAAFVWSRDDRSGTTPTEPVRVAVDSTSQPVKGRVLWAIGNRPGTFIAKPDEPMPAHFMIQSGGIQSTTGDYLDETPPVAPRIMDSSVEHDDSGEGCAGGASSCAGLTSLIVTLAERVKDDHVPAGRLAYFIYLEKSADAARTTHTPFAIVSELGAVNMATLVLTLDPSWADSDAFVSVSAIDWAANESPRTEPHQANASGIGCAVSLPRQHRPKLATGLAMLTGLAWARRWRRRRSNIAS
jgi:hypothetical protein